MKATSFKEPVSVQTQIKNLTMDKVGKLLLFTLFSFAFSVTLFGQNSALILNGADVIMHGGNDSQSVYLVVDEEGTDGIIRHDGRIISENQYNYVKWLTHTNTGDYIFPFGVLENQDNYLPFSFEKSTGNATNIMVSTWATNTANEPYPEATNVGAVTSMTGTADPIPHAIDRFWDIQAESGTTADLSFSYRGVENTTDNPTGEVATQHWNGSSWDDPVVSSSEGVVSGVGQAGPYVGQNTFSPWVLVIIEDCPEDSIHYDVAEFCADDESVYEVQHENDTLTGLYSGFPTGLDIDVNTGEITPANSEAGTYTITYTIEESNACPEIEVTTSITILPELSVNFDITEVACEGGENGSITATIEGGNDPYTYQWNNGETTQTISDLTAGDYTVTVTDNNGCSAADEATLTDGDAGLVLDFEIDNVSCLEDNDGSITVVPQNGTAPYSYAWNTGETTQTIENLTVGEYAVTVIDNNSCSSSETVTVTQQPSIELEGSITAASCGEDDGAILLSVSGGSGAYTFQWSNGQTEESISDLSAGEYTVTVADESGCEITEVFVVPSGEDLNIHIQPNDLTIQEGDSVELTVEVEGGGSGATYAWTPTDGLSCSDCPNPIASPSVTTTYTVTVTQPNGCVGEDQVEVKVENPCTEIYVPNIFSPNNDGKNDMFCVYGDKNCIESFQLKIYDRWGATIFESMDINDCWNGRYKDKKLNTGAYVYDLKVKTIDGKDVSEAGNIILVR